MEFYHLSDYSRGIKVWVGKKMTTTSVQAVKNRLENVAVLVVGKKGPFGHDVYECPSHKPQLCDSLSCDIELSFFVSFCSVTYIHSSSSFPIYYSYIHVKKTTEKTLSSEKTTLYVRWIFWQEASLFLVKLYGTFDYKLYTVVLLRVASVGNVTKVNKTITYCCSCLDCALSRQYSLRLPLRTSTTTNIAIWPLTMRFWPYCWVHIHLNHFPLFSIFWYITTYLNG